MQVLSNLAGPIQHFRSAVLEGWRGKVSADLCASTGFRGSLLDIHGFLQLLNSTHVRERDKALLRSILVGGVWNGFLLRGLRVSGCLVGSVGGTDSDGHLFGECPFPPLVEIRAHPEFQILWRWISRLGLGVCFGMVGCLFFWSKWWFPLG